MPVLGNRVGASPWVAILTVTLVNSLLYIRNLSLPVSVQKKQGSSTCSRVCEERDGWGVMDVADTVVNVYVKIRNWVPDNVVVMSDHMCLVTSWQSKKVWLLHGPYISPWLTMFLCRLRTTL